MMQNYIFFFACLLICIVDNDEVRSAYRSISWIFTEADWLSGELILNPQADQCWSKYLSDSFELYQWFDFFFTIHLLILVNIQKLAQADLVKG
jgi:hypothetical protein